MKLSSGGGTTSIRSSWGTWVGVASRAVSTVAIGFSSWWLLEGCRGWQIDWECNSLTFSESRHGGTPVDSYQPLVVGLGGTVRPNSSTEQAIRVALCAAEAAGARTRFFGGPALSTLPMYNPEV